MKNRGENPNVTAKSLAAQRIIFVHSTYLPGPPGLDLVHQGTRGNAARIAKEGSKSLVWLVFNR